MNKFITLCLIGFTGCTFNIIQTDTHGVASDVVDDTSTNDVKPQTDLSIPLVGK